MGFSFSIGLSRSDGKRPEGLTLVPRQNGKAIYCAVTVSLLEFNM